MKLSLSAILHFTLLKCFLSILSGESGVQSEHNAVSPSNTHQVCFTTCKILIQYADYYIYIYTSPVREDVHRVGN